MFKNTTILFIFILLLEIVFRLISGIEVFSPSIIRVVLGALIASIVLGYILSFTKKKTNKVLMIILAFVFTLYTFLQIGFKNFLGVYISFNTSSQLGAVMDYVREFIKSFLPKFYLILIPFVLLLVYYFIIDKHTELKHDKKFILKKYNNHEGSIKTITMILLVSVLSYFYYDSLTASFMQNKFQTISTLELFKNPSVPSTVVNEFGVLGFGFLDVTTLNKEVTDTPVKYYASNNHIISDRVIDDTVWKNVNDKETNDVYKSINEYLMNRPIPNYNEYTGLFKGKNLIIIMMESVNEIFINEDWFPNFYKLYNEGFHFVNNYSPRNSCSTGNNEFSGLTSLYTIYNNCTANIYRDNKYYTSLFNLFTDAGYNSTSMHNYTEAYYYRKTIHPNLGSKRYYGVEDLGIEYHNEYRNWSSDADFMDVAMDITLKDTSKPFMLWLTTVSSHQPYVVSSIEGDKHLDLFKDTDYPMDLKRYLSKLKTLDEGLGILLDRLEKQGILDDTVIALYGDHYPYGLKNDTINKILPYELDDYETERVPFTIYNSEIKPQKIEKYTSFINLAPTIANLFGLNYDPRLYMGSDIFNNDYIDMVTFPDGSWKNKDIFYNAANGNVKYYGDKTYTNEEIINRNNLITSKMKMSGLIIRNNYYDYLDKKLQEEESIMNNGKESK